MATCRIKDIWMVRSAFERTYNLKMPIAAAAELATAIDPLWVAYMDYQASRKSKWQELKLDRENDEKAKDRAKRVMAFNDWADEASQEEIKLHPAVRVTDLDGAVISPLDLMLMKQIGLVRA